MVMCQSERSKVVKMENCTVFWIKLDWWIWSEAVNIKSKAVIFRRTVYFLAIVHFKDLQLQTYFEKMTNRQGVKEYLIGYILCSLRSAVLDWGSFSSRLLKSTSFSEAHFEIHKNEAQTNWEKICQRFDYGRVSGLLYIGWEQFQDF